MVDWLHVIKTGEISLPSALLLFALKSNKFIVVVSNVQNGLIKLSKVLINYGTLLLEDVSLVYDRSTTNLERYTCGFSLDICNTST